MRGAILGVSVQRLVIGGAAWCALAVGFAGPARADETVRAYLATSEVDTASGSTLARDVLLVRFHGEGSSVSLVRGNVATPPIDVSFAPDGEMRVPTSDPSIACYNMGALLANAARHPAATPASVYFAVANNAVAIQMPVRSSQGPNGSTSVRGAGRADVRVDTGGTPEVLGVVVDGEVDDLRGDVQRAVFSEYTTLATTSAPLSRTVCTLTLLPAALPS
ncbi:MAG: hypothetical protein IAI49_02575 [Candidatus Eremiobacteraeota bacterium]|nr:hypothetical protein [Candidatus Eremiobacteraeota bacterium]